MWRMLHFGLNTRPSACITVRLSSQPNDLNLFFFAAFDLLLLFSAEPDDVLVHFASVSVSSLQESVNARRENKINHNSPLNDS